MKKHFLLFLFSVGFISAWSQNSNGYKLSHPFRFAFISDTHIGSPDGSAEEDLRRTVRDINAMKDSISFVVITGDITELGSNAELLRAKRILDSLEVKYYIIPGNHDTGWSESGGLMFTTVFGYDRFSFEWEGIRFLGCASGPYVRMSDGHVPKDAVNWLDKELHSLAPNQPVIFLNHYPINDQLDNWYEITGRLHHYNTWAILCGHGHTNKAFSFEDIPGVMGRSNLRAKAAVGGYNLVDVQNDSIFFRERKPLIRTLPAWTTVGITNMHYDTGKVYTRPDYSINTKYPNVKETWFASSSANIISTAAVADGLVITCNQQGEVMASLLANGRRKWTFQTNSPIFSSPLLYNGAVIFGCTNGSVFSVNATNGSLIWQQPAGVPVLGCAVADQEEVYIGGSGKFFAMDARTGNIKWSFPTEGPVVGAATLHNNALVFGAWDTYLYCVNKADGSLRWKWSNGSTVRNYSPASCIPIVINDVVYVVAPDRYLSAIDFKTGQPLWRNNDATVRESDGVSADGQWIFAKTMMDTVVAYHTSREKQSVAWKINCGFGYEHVPSMLIEKDGYIFFGTRSGVIYCVNTTSKQVKWAHKVDNSMVNTVRVISKHQLVATTMDGKTVLLQASGY
jgi:outer membrane protein assembly factor BamB/predicted phosphodiesterase